MGKRALPREERGSWVVKMFAAKSAAHSATLNP